MLLVINLFAAISTKWQTLKAMQWVLKYKPEPMYEQMQCNKWLFPQV